MVRRIILLGFVLAFVFPAIAGAQSADERFRDRYGHNCCQNWAEFEYHCEKLQGGTAEKNPARCSARGTIESSAGRNMLKFGGSPFRAIAQSAIVYGSLGCAAGSFAKDVNGSQQCVAVSLLTAGTAGLANRLAAKGWSTPAKILVSGASCAAIAGSVATYQQGQELTGSPESEAAKQNLAKYAGMAAGGCAAAELLGGMMPDSEMRFFRALSALLRPGRGVALLQRGNQLGANIEW